MFQKINKSKNIKVDNLIPNNKVNNVFELEKTSAKMTLSDVFSQKKHIYLNGFMLFVAHYNSIPNSIYEADIDSERVNVWL